MRVSVVIPFFNNSATLSETLNSVIGQTFSAWEAICVDDGSTDGSFDIATTIANKDKRVKIVKRPDYLPKGANACRNYGASISSSDLLVFLDADDLLHTHCLQTRVDFYKEKPCKVIFFSMGTFMDIEEVSLTEIVRKSDQPISIDTALKSFLDYNLLWNTMSGLWQKSFFDSIGRFDEELLRFQDYDLHLKALTSIKDSECIIYPNNFADCFYRQSKFHKKITRSTKSSVYHSLEKLMRNKDYHFGPGFYRYLVKNYSDYFALHNNWTDLGLDKIDVLKHRVLRVFRFNLLAYRIIAKLLYWRSIIRAVSSK